MHRPFASALALFLMAAPIAAARAAPVPTAGAVADRIAAAMTDTEQWAIASDFPPDYAPIEIARYALVAIDAAEAPRAVEIRALDLVAARKLSDSQVEAIGILRREVAND